MTSTLRVAGRYLEARAAKYQAKKKVPKADGTGETTIYVYSERQVQNRHREKAERLESLRGKISDIRKRYRRELAHEDPRTRLTALAVGLIDETYERVGNPQSKENGHYGITTLTKDHVTFGPEGAILRYTGKSGVDHEKRVEDSKLVGALRAALKGKKAKDSVFCEGEDCVVSAKDVNAFLKEYDVTAKDLRGLHANEEVRTRLKAIRKKGPSLPEDAKEREKLLKSEFKQALQEAAEAVGHEPATLRGQYLVPGLEEAYLKDGKVMSKLNKKSSASPDPYRVASRYATLSQPEKEDRESERLVRKSPKKKPPRKDLRRRRVQDQEDDPDKKQDRKDRSNNYKDASGVLQDLLDGFFRRHPKLTPYRKAIRFRARDKGGSSGHGEAQQHGDEVWLFPKFWGHDPQVQDFVLAHEIGHWVKSEFGGREFLTLANALGIDPWDSSALPFGQFNMDEAFADCFASYYTDGDAQRRYPEWARLVEAVEGKRPARVAGQSAKKFLEEEGDKTVRSPDTGEDVKLRSLASAPPNSKSRKLYDKMRTQWAEKKDKEEKEQGKNGPASVAEIAKGLASDDPREREEAITDLLEDVSDYVDLKGLELSPEKSEDSADDIEDDLYTKFSSALRGVLDDNYDALMEKAKAKAGEGATPEGLSKAFMGEAMEEFSRKADAIVSRELYVREKKEEKKEKKKKEEALDSWLSALGGTLYDDGVAKDVEDLDDVADKSSFKEEYEARLSSLADQEDNPSFRKQVEKSRKIVDGFDKNKIPKDPEGRKKALKEYAEAVARVQHFEEVINDPLSVFKGGVTDQDAVSAALEKYAQSEDLVEKHTKKLDARIEKLSEPPEDGEDDDQKAAREKELKKAQTVRKVLAAKKILSEGVGGGGVPKAVSRLYIAAEKAGRLEDLITMDDSGGDAESQELLRDVYSRLPLEDLVKLLDEDHPGRKILENVNDPDSLASQDEKEGFRKFVEDMLVAEVAFADEGGDEDDGSDEGDGGRRRRDRLDDPSSPNFFDKLMEALEKAKSNFSEILSKTKEYTSQYIRGLAGRRRTAHLIRMSREWDFTPWEE